MSASPKLADLLAAAREDAPPSELRDEVWGRVVAVTAAPTAVVAVKALSLPSAGKLVTLGAVLGIASTLAALAVGFDDARATKDLPERAPAVVVHGAGVGARLADPTPRARATIAPPPPAPSSTPAPIAAPRAPDAASTLEAEARLVTEIRAALLRSDAEQALALGGVVERLPAHALEPEELALRVRALRALGRTDEALAAELTLRRRFPDSALGR